MANTTDNSDDNDGLLAKIKQDAAPTHEERVRLLLESAQKMREAFAKNVTSQESYDALMVEIEEAREKIWQEELKMRKERDAQ